MPSASARNPNVSEKISTTAAAANMPAPVPTFFTVARSSSFASAISFCTRFEDSVSTVLTSSPMLGSAGTAAACAPPGLGEVL